MTTKEAMEKFQNIKMTKIIEQIKATPTPILDKFYKSAEGSVGSTIEVPIKKSDAFILKAISKEADSSLIESKDVYILQLKIPRFALRDMIFASDLNELKSYENSTDMLEALSKKIANIIKSHKSSYLATQEFMAVGAMFGKVIDGSGTVLFEYKKQTEVQFSDSKDLQSSIAEIQDSLVKALGYLPDFEVYVSREFHNALYAKADKEGLFDNQGRAKVREKGALEVHGVSFIPYVAQYKNEKGKATNFLSAKEGMAIPQTEGVFKLFYARANHVEALSKAPQRFFAASPEELGGGKGYAILSESNVLPVCLNPESLVKVTWA